MIVKGAAAIHRTHMSVAAAQIRMLEACLSKSVTRVSRVVYNYRGVVEDWHAAPVELEFYDGTTLHLRDIDGGDSLGVESSSWEDPLQDPDEETEEFIRRCGKWTKYDVSTKDSYECLIGQRFEWFRPLVSQLDRFAGVECGIGTQVLTVYAVADECFVYLGEQHERLRTMQYKFGARTRSDAPVSE